MIAPAPRTLERVVAATYGLIMLTLAYTSVDAIGDGGIRLTLPYVWPSLMAFGGTVALVTVFAHTWWLWALALVGLTGGPIGRAWDIADQAGDLGRPWQATAQWATMGIALTVSWIVVGMMVGLSRVGDGET